MNMSKSFKRLNVCSIAIALAVAALTVGSQGANAAEMPSSVEGGISPVLVLSAKMGDVGIEAVGMGLPVLRDKNLAGDAIDMMLYVDVDTLKDSDYRAVFDLVRKSLSRGRSAVIETSTFNFEKMHNIVATEFPMIKRSDIADVAVLLQLEGGVITAKRVDPSEMAVYAGLSFKNTTAGKFFESSEKARTVAKSAVAKGFTLEGFYRQFAAKAYESNPTVSQWTLKHNSSYVDFWVKNRTNHTQCVVAWRGTVTTNIWDIYADLRSQISATNARINDVGGQVLVGGTGFVSRLHSNDNTIKQAMLDAGCDEITITGHSLGGALAQLHGMQIHFGNSFPGGTKRMYAWNSPRVVDSSTYDIAAATLVSVYNVWKSYCRNHDFLVNPVPTGLYRLAPRNSATVRQCSFVGDGVSTINPNTNHELSLWENEFPSQ